MPDSFDYTTGTNSENVRLLQALIDDAPEYTEETNSRNANILKSIINNTEYTDAPQSEIEELLLRLKAKIGGEIEVEELTVTENGTYDAGVNKAYNPVTVELPLSSKTITENGTYTASDDNLAGYDEVTVAVEGYAKKSIANTPTPIATFNASALPIPSLTVGIEAVQSGTGDPSPTNVRPFSGWSEVNVYDTGKNLFNIDSEHTTSGATYLYNLKVKPNTTYTMSSNVPQEDVASLYFNGGSTNSNGVWEGQPRTFTSDADGNIIAYVRFYASSQGGIDLYTAVKNGTYYIQLEEGSFDTEYEPFGATYTTTLKDGQGNPMECYGGELSNVNGGQNLTADATENQKVKLSDLTWTYQSSDERFYCDTPITVKRPSSNTELPVYFGCECYKAVPYSSYTNGNITITSSGSMFVKDSNYTDTTTWLNAVGNNNILLPLATPTQIPQDNLAIATQEGTNNLWADTGDVLSGEYLEAL